MLEGFQRKGFVLPFHSIHPDTPEGYRRCTKCGLDKPETTEYFKPQKGARNGLMASCRECHNQWARERHLKHPEIKKAQRARYDPEKKKRDARNDRERNKASYQRRSKTWHEVNREYAKETKHQDYLRNRERRIEMANEWQRNNPDKVRVRSNRRQARKRALPDNFTQQDWDNAVAYWHGACAYCGKPLYGLFDDIKAHADHFIPLASPDCVGTVPGNILRA